MKTKKVGHKKGLRRAVFVDPKHPLAGTWEEEPNPNGTTTVVYTVLVKEGKFGVRARDRQDGIDFKISRIKWDGEALSFKSLYPPTMHSADHALRLLSKTKLSHYIDCTYADGDSFSGQEIWRKCHGEK